MTNWRGLKLNDRREAQKKDAQRLRSEGEGGKLCPVTRIAFLFCLIGSEREGI